MSDTLPDAVKPLKSKTKLCCAEIVIVMELLWNLLQKPEEFAADKPGCAPMHKNDCTARTGSAAIAVRFKFPEQNEGRE